MAYPTKKKSSVTSESIVRDVRAGKLAPVYYLMGEESYYIDRLAEFLVQSVLTFEERDFNLITLFGAETTIEDVITLSRNYPMGAQRQVVMVKEAQNLSGIDKLELYLKKPQPTTVLIFCHKNGKLDGRSKLHSLLSKVGVVFESEQLREAQLRPFINDYLRRKQLTIEEEATEMMIEYIGTDLNRMAGELDKLAIAMPQGEKNITAALVASNTGISKEYNIFEFQDALCRKDVLKVNKIAKFFDSNPKANPIQRTLPMLFRFFTNVMLAYYAPVKTEQGVAAWLGQSEWQVRKNVLPAMQQYRAGKVMKILSEIRRTDARSKGVGNPMISDGELMRELLHYILH